MSIYQKRGDIPPDSEFEPGVYAHLVVGNRGRLLDPRRTPVSIASLATATGCFVVRIEDFEDEGACWEVPFEEIDRYQFEKGSPTAPASLVQEAEAAVARLDKPLAIASDPARRRTTLMQLDEAREAASVWIAGHSRFFAEGRNLPAADTREGDPVLAADLRAFMEFLDLWDLESAFAERFVSNPYSGELVKGHRIVLAELGLVAYEDKVVRDPGLFDGAWSRERRKDHILARMGFVHALFSRAGVDPVVLYRGVSTEDTLQPPSNRTFVSASFSLEVARSHFESGSPTATRALFRQAVPIGRLFMTYHETAAMNAQFKEAEAVLLFEEDNRVF